jgi:hypothetical protein
MSAANSDGPPLKHEGPSSEERLQYNTRSRGGVQTTCLDCGELISRGYSRCERCKLDKERARNRSRSHYKGSWPSIAKKAKQRHPWCAECGTRKGPFEADHVIPRSLAGGVRVLCLPCHQEKTKRERVPA